MGGVRGCRLAHKGDFSHAAKRKTEGVSVRLQPKAGELAPTPIVAALSKRRHLARARHGTSGVERYGASADEFEFHDVTPWNPAKRT